MLYGSLEGRYFLSHDDVRAALDAMITASDTSDLSVLKSLVIVSEFLADPDVPSIDPQSNYAVFAILERIISSTLNHYRTVLDVQLNQNPQKLADYVSNIQLDSKSQSTELLAWSMLYHCYVRVDLNLSPDQFANHAGISTRTLRRHKTSVIEQLTNLIIGEERRARIDRRVRILKAQLPGRVNLFIGRESNRDKLLSQLDGHEHAKILVSGAPGVGKSVFVEHTLMCYLLEHGEATHFNRLVWLDSPTDYEQALAGLREMLLPPHSSVNLTEWMQVYRVLIILDGCDRLLENGELMHLISDLHMATIIITTSKLPIMPRFNQRIVLSELNQATALLLIRHICSSVVTDEQLITEKEINRIYQTTGGNPQAIQLYVPFYIIGDVKPEHGTIDALFETAYSTLHEDAKYTWIALNLCPPGQVLSLEQLQILWPDHITQETISTLIRTHLIEANRRGVNVGQLSSVARHYFSEIYRKSPQVRQMVDELVGVLADTVYILPDIGLATIEYIISVDYLVINQNILENWGLILKVNYPQLFAAEVMHDDTNDRQRLSELKQILTKGITLRQSLHFDEAEFYLRAAIQQAGEMGTFELQSVARLELSLILRHHGQYQKAIQLLRSTEVVSRRYGNEAMFHMTLYELAQIAIDQRDGEQALKLLNDIPEGQRDNIRYSLLMAETLLLLGHFAECQQHATTAAHLIDSHNDRRTQGLIHDVLGRSHYWSQNYHKAEQHLRTSISHFEACDDPYALARGLTNLSAVLIAIDTQEARGEAREMLEVAIEIQKTIRDELGLVHSRQNAAYL